MLTAKVGIKVSGSTITVERVERPWENVKMDEGYEYRLDPETKMLQKRRIA